MYTICILYKNSRIRYLFDPSFFPPVGGSVGAPLAVPLVPRWRFRWCPVGVPLVLRFCCNSINKVKNC